MSFTSDIEKFKDKVEVATEKTFRGSILEIFASIIRRTPVKTGRARGNWQASLNRYANLAIFAKPVAAITRARTTASKAKTSDTVYMVNNLPYIKELEEGSSLQAPAGMVRVTIAEWKRIVAKQARANKK